MVCGVTMIWSYLLGCREFHFFISSFLYVPQLSCVITIVRAVITRSTNTVYIYFCHFCFYCVQPSEDGCRETCVDTSQCAAGLTCQEQTCTGRCSSAVECGQSGYMCSTECKSTRIFIPDIIHVTDCLIYPWNKSGLQVWLHNIGLNINNPYGDYVVHKPKKISAFTWSCCVSMHLLF